MSTNFPASQDTFTNPGANDPTNSNTVPHNAQHDNANDAIAAIEGVLLNGTSYPLALVKRSDQPGGDVSGTAAGPLTVTAIQGHAVSSTAPTSNQILSWNGSAWVPKTTTETAVPASTVTGPDAFGAAHAVGTSNNYAREDHDHGLPANPVNISGTPAAVGQANGTGSSGTLPNSDHVHQGVTSVTAGTNVTISGGDGSGHGALTINATGGAANVPNPAAGPAQGQVLMGTSASTDAWTPMAQLFTASGTYTIPAAATLLEVTCVGGGGGGAGGGSSTNTNFQQAGGGGGGAGAVTRNVVPVGSATSLTVTVGAGGGGGNGGAGGGSNAGANGSSGGSSSATGTGISCSANGGWYGMGVAGNSSGAVGYGGFYGSAGVQVFNPNYASQNHPIPPGTGGDGLGGGSQGGSGGDPAGGGGGGGAGGGSAEAHGLGIGGYGGAAGTGNSGGASDSVTTSTAAGAAGAAAAANSGAGGGGGGGGTSSSAGGHGGAGGSGYVLVRVLA